MEGTCPNHQATQTVCFCYGRQSKLGRLNMKAMPLVGLVQPKLGNTKPGLWPLGHEDHARGTRGSCKNRWFIHKALCPFQGSSGPLFEAKTLFEQNRPLVFWATLGHHEHTQRIEHHFGELPSLPYPPPPGKDRPRKGLAVVFVSLRCFRWGAGGMRELLNMGVGALLIGGLGKPQRELLQMAFTRVWFGF